MTNIDSIEIEYGGTIMTVAQMKHKLKSGYASYWHWHTILTETASAYRIAREKEDYGVLLPSEMVIDEKSFSELEGAIENGAYNKKRLMKLLDMYAFLVGKAGK